MPVTRRPTGSIFTAIFTVIFKHSVPTEIQKGQIFRLVGGATGSRRKMPISSSASLLSRAVALSGQPSSIGSEVPFASGDLGAGSARCSASAVNGAAGSARHTATGGGSSLGGGSAAPWDAGDDATGAYDYYNDDALLGDFPDGDAGAVPWGEEGAGGRTGFGHGPRMGPTDLGEFSRLTLGTSTEASLRLSRAGGEQSIVGVA